MQTTIISTGAERVPFWSALVKDRRMAPALGLGFTSGMPFLLTYSTQSAWLTDAGVPLATIGLLFFNTNAGTDGEWHRRWLQYRHLAESLRLLIYLADS